MLRVQDSDRKHLIAFPRGAKGQTPHDGPWDINLEQKFTL